MKVHTVIPDKLYFARRFKPGNREETLEVLRYYHIGAIINLWHMRDNTAAVWCISQGGHYLMKSMPDGMVTDRATWLQLAMFGAGYLAQSRTLLVQCYGGKNRSALLAGLVYMAHTGRNGVQALEIIHSAYPGALVNSWFRTFLVTGGEGGATQTL